MMTRSTVAMLAGMLAVLLPGCEKENEVDASKTTTGIGGQCSGPGDPGCGTSGVCVLGFCRLGCATDGECPQGALCLGQTPPYGCSLQTELDCNKSPGACKAPLACGIDGKCRFGCTKDTDCPRNEQACMAGTCVSKNEPGADQTWFSCGMGGTPYSTAVMCYGPDPDKAVNQLRVCNVTAPGWTTAKDCNCTRKCPDPAQFPRNNVGWCQCDLVELNPNCGAPCGDCVADPTCTICAAEKYTPDCDANPAYKALTQCGCMAKAPDGIDCAACRKYASGCIENPMADAEAVDACVASAASPDCNSPGVAQWFDCLCKSTTCAIACAAQCTATGH